MEGGADQQRLPCRAIALRAGDWKIVAAGEDGPWELYNLADDPTETCNLASEQPDKVHTLAQQWHRRNAEFTEQARRDLPPARSTRPTPKKKVARPSS